MVIRPELTDEFNEKVYISGFCHLRIFPGPAENNASSDPYAIEESWVRAYVELIGSRLHIWCAGTCDIDPSSIAKLKDASYQRRRKSCKKVTSDDNNASDERKAAKNKGKRLFVCPVSSSFTGKNCGDQIVHFSLDSHVFVGHVKVVHDRPSGRKNCYSATPLPPDVFESFVESSSSPSPSDPPSPNPSKNAPPSSPKKHGSSAVSSLNENSTVDHIAVSRALRHTVLEVRYFDNTCKQCLSTTHTGQPNTATWRGLQMQFSSLSLLERWRLGVELMLFEYKMLSFTSTRCFLNMRRESSVDDPSASSSSFSASNPHSHLRPGQINLFNHDILFPHPYYSKGWQKAHLVFVPPFPMDLMLEAFGISNEMYASLHGQLSYSSTGEKLETYSSPMILIYKDEKQKRLSGIFEISSVYVIVQNDNKKQTDGKVGAASQSTETMHEYIVEGTGHLISRKHFSPSYSLFPNQPGGISSSKDSRLKKTGGSYLAASWDRSLQLPSHHKHLLCPGETVNGDTGGEDEDQDEDEEEQISATSEAQDHHYQSIVEYMNLLHKQLTSKKGDKEDYFSTDKKAKTIFLGNASHAIGRHHVQRIYSLRLGTFDRQECSSVVEYIEYHLSKLSSFARYDSSSSSPISHLELLKLCRHCSYLPSCLSLPFGQPRIQLPFHFSMEDTDSCNTEPPHNSNLNDHVQFGPYSWCALPQAMLSSAPSDIYFELKEILPALDNKGLLKRLIYQPSSVIYVIQPFEEKFRQVLDLLSSKEGQDNDRKDDKYEALRSDELWKYLTSVPSSSEIQHWLSICLWRKRSRQQRDQPPPLPSVVLSSPPEKTSAGPLINVQDIIPPFYKASKIILSESQSDCSGSPSSLRSCGKPGLVDHQIVSSQRETAATVLRHDQQLIQSNSTYITAGRCSQSELPTRPLSTQTSSLFSEQPAITAVSTASFAKTMQAPPTQPGLPSHSLAYQRSAYYPGAPLGPPGSSTPVSVSYTPVPSPLVAPNSFMPFAPSPFHQTSSPQPYSTSSPFAYQYYAQGSPSLQPQAGFSPALMRPAFSTPSYFLHAPSYENLPNLQPGQMPAHRFAYSTEFPAMMMGQNGVAGCFYGSPGDYPQQFMSPFSYHPSTLAQPQMPFTSSPLMMNHPTAMAPYLIPPSPALSLHAPQSLMQQHPSPVPSIPTTPLGYGYNLSLRQRTSFNDLRYPSTPPLSATSSPTFHPSPTCYQASAAQPPSLRNRNRSEMQHKQSISADNDDDELPLSSMMSKG